MNAPPASVTDICLTCGLCCDGGLFAGVKLDAADQRRLREAGYEAPKRLPHRCCHLSAGACSIYPARPSTCRAFHCGVLNSLEEGAIDLETAQSRIKEALSLREGMKASAPGGTTVVELAREWKRNDRPRSAEEVRATLAAVTYWMFVERYFLAPEDRRVTGLELNHP